MRSFGRIHSNALKLPGTYARRGSTSRWSLKGLSGGVMLRSYVRCDRCQSEAQIAKTCGVSQAAMGGEAIKDGRLR